MNDFIFIDLRLDFAFQYVFGREGNEDLLIKLLNAILPEQHISSVTLTNRKKLNNRRNARNAVYDIACKTSGGELVTIEMQYRSQDDFNQRLQFYSAFPVLNGLPQGKTDGGKMSYSFPPMYVIGITNFILKEVKPNDNMINYYGVLNRKDPTIALSDRVNYVTVELPKFKKKPCELVSPADYLISAIKNIHSWTDKPKEFEGKDLDKMFELCKFANMNQLFQEEYIRARMAEMDRHSQMLTAQREGREAGLAEGRALGLELGREEGREAGLAEGREEGKLETAKELKRLKVPSDIIQKATGLTAEQISVL